jgi:hypothetical protein
MLIPSGLIGTDNILTKRRGAPAWSPLSKTGLIQWHKADALSLNNNDPVASWPDSSGNGWTKTQATSGNRPLYKTNQRNGKPSVDFDGLNDYLSGNVNHNIGTGQFTWTFVFQYQTTSNDNQCILANGNYSPGIFMRSNTPRYSRFYWDGDYGAGFLEMNVNSWYSLIVLGIRTGNQVTFYLNGASQTITPSFFSAKSMTNGSMQLGFSGFGGEIFGGQIAEHCFWNSLLTTTEQASYNSYIATKYGLGG